MNTRIILWLSLLSTTFIVSPGLWDATVTGKYFYFASVTGAASLFSAYYLLRNRMTLHICLTDILVFLFALWVGVSCIINGMRPGMRLWLFILLVPLYMVIRISLRDQSMIRPLLGVVLLVVTVEAIWGLLQLYGILKSHNRLVTGSFFNSGPYSGFLACGIPIALCLFLNGRSKPEKFSGLLCLLVIGLILPAAMSRAAWLAAVTGSIPVAGRFLYRYCYRLLATQRFKKAALLAITAIVLSGVLFSLYSLRKASADGRMLYWRVSAELVREKPLTGHGLGSFPVLYEDAQADFFISGKGNEKQKRLAGNGPEYAFNEYVQITVEHGITGLVLFLGMIFSSLGFRSAGEPEESAVRGSLTTFLVFAFFSYPFSVLPLTIMFVILIAMSASYARPVRQVSGLVVGVLCLGLSGYASVEILSRYPAYREWKTAQVSYDTGYWEQAVEKYNNLYAKLNRQPQYLFEYACCLSAMGQYEASNELLDRYLLFGSDPVIYYCKGNNYKNKRDFKSAEKMYIRASEILPGRYQPLKLLMDLYEETGQNEKAKAIHEFFESERRKYESIIRR
ncbi:MAG: O-antigen ligase family protein [Bacteroidales bacterium]|jgi:O-antigen ligase|nr:O-antigen ligase family protein [Bacteroidales bacterium]